MASRKEHNADCERLLGFKCDPVNKWLDEKFKHLGPLHRCIRHHTKGILEASLKFGELGRKAAIIHILKDCGHIPTFEDWHHPSKLNHLGMIEASTFNGYWDIHKFDEEVKKLLEMS